MDQPCWLWTGALNSAGYGHIQINKKRRRTHRLVYEALVGPIPEGHHIHHTCGTRACVNPAHLQALSRAAHNGTRRTTKTSCIHGHDWKDPRNVQTGSNGKRYCKECKRQRRRAQYRTQKERISNVA